MESLQGHDYFSRRPGLDMSGSGNQQFYRHFRIPCTIQTCEGRYIRAAVEKRSHIITSFKFGNKLEEGKCIQSLTGRTDKLLRSKLWNLRGILTLNV